MNSLIRFLVVAGLCAAGHVFAADSFEGKVTLAMTSGKGRAQDMTYSMKGQKIRMDMKAEGHEMSSIMDLAKLEMLMLMPEQKMYMVMPIKKPVEQAMEKQGASTAEVEVTGKTDTILGYKCSQILVKDKDTVTEMWVAEGLGMFMGMGSGGGGGGPFGGGRKPAAAKWEEALKGKGGFPLRVISHDLKGKETFKMEATKIEPGVRPDSDFVPPAGYQKFQMPDLGGLNPFKRN
ncbi:MAG: DUF4412 domain-containing protein [bacterium]|nr:DUF4412 domain-containing protein [bacterium]MDI1334780.1 DUF4412 domain-containing protein [Lacunisphaera sp.]